MEENAPHHTESSVMEEKIPHHTESSVMGENAPHHTESSVMEEKIPHHTESSVMEENAPHHTESSVMEEKIPHHTEPSVMGENAPHHTESSVMEENAHRTESSLMEENTPHHTESSLMEEKIPHHTESSPMEERLSCFNNVKLFLAALSFAVFAKLFSEGYMKSTITQIERRFDIPSSLIGIIDGSFEIGNLMVIVFVSHFGAKFHRPKLIGAGMVVMAIGTFIIALPHFIMGRYDYESAIKSSHNSTSNVSLCSIDPYNKLKSESMDTSSLIPKLGCENTVKSALWIYVFLGNLLRGIGETPVLPLGVSYLDDHAKRENFAFYLGCMYTLGFLGPTFGFVLGSFCATLFVDIGFVSSGSLTITPKDTRWVGAWWLGFLLAGVISILAAIPLFFFPKTMPIEGKGKKRLCRSMKRAEEEDYSGPSHTSPRSSKLSSVAKDFLPSVKSLICNPIYFLILLQSVLQVSSIMGMLIFRPKFIEQHYGQTASRANLLVGIVSVPPVAIGIFCGGVVMKTFKLNVIQAAKFSIGGSFAAWMLLILFFAMGCKRAPVMGLTISYEGITQSSHEERSLFSECNAGCMCSRTQWEPVCAENGMTYVSPCLAGCRSSNGTGIKMEFHNCSCISHLTSANSAAILGQCPIDDDCTKVFPYYLAVTAIESFSYSVGAMAMIEILFRSIEPELKPLALGMSNLIVRMIAGIPAPIYFGALIDTTCLKWGTKRCGGRGACRMYDLDAFRYIYFGVAAGIEGICFALYIPFYMQLKKHFQLEDKKALGNECTELAIMNEDNDHIDCDL
ncbi:solute carrier organic anion transporter family member 1C1-like [Heptranchias perlo]|uniref:solute carrier organic anion transporter family member 1C1-like n=1 Tax=Heptranchias perlo TaxID=212740 RepID=UPI00355A2EDE